MKLDFFVRVEKSIFRSWLSLISRGRLAFGSGAHSEFGFGLSLRRKMSFGNSLNLACVSSNGLSLSEAPQSLVQILSTVLIVEFIQIPAHMNKYFLETSLIQPACTRTVEYCVIRQHVIDSSFTLQPLCFVSVGVT